MASLELLTPQTWEAFTKAPLALMLIGKSDCDACKAWAQELDIFLGSGAAPAGLRAGKLLLDQPGFVSFKRANPWIAELDVLPTNVLWSNGQRLKTWSGGGIERLTNRLERLQADATP